MGHFCTHWVLFLTKCEIRVERLSVTSIMLGQGGFPMGTVGLFVIDSTLSSKSHILKMLVKSKKTLTKTGMHTRSNGY